jgi:hypothetical protein
MIPEPARNGHAAPQTIKVPAEKRPPLGTGAPLPLEHAVERGTAAIAAVSDQNRALLRKLLSAMNDVVASSSTDTLDAASQERLLAVATDLRGVAVMLGSPITSEVANTIYRMAEHPDAASGLTRSLLMLLIEGNGKILDFGDTAGPFERELRDLLAKLAKGGAVSAKPPLKAQA